MKLRIIGILSKLPFGKRLILSLRDIARRKNLKKFSSSEDLFTNYYMENKWSDSESVSGPGSTAAYTANIRRELPPLFSRFQIISMIDAPCGDYNWFRMIDRSGGPDYIGGDIVQALAESNAERYQDDRTRFVKFDVTKDQLPDVDLWLCRDCLFHLSEDLVFAALRNFAKSNVKWLLTSTHPHAEFNSDITTGSFRLINLEKPPYNLPAPELVMEDWIPPFPKRHLALWSRESVLKVLNMRKS
jgi:hypothetical protein